MSKAKQRDLALANAFLAAAHCNRWEFRDETALAFVHELKRYILTTHGESAPQEPCEHDWRYVGTDRGGSHKGEVDVRCFKCSKSEYQP